MERPDPFSAGAQDRTYWIALDALPAGWSVSWKSEADKPLRLAISSPRHDVYLDVLAFKGELDAGKMMALAGTIMGSKWPSPEATSKFDDAYGRRGTRFIYPRMANGDSTTLVTVDYVFDRAEWENFGYFVIGTELRSTPGVIETARRALHLCPPRLTAFGVFLKGFETIYHWIRSTIGIFALIFGIGFGLTWLWFRLRGAGVAIKGILAAVLIAATLLGRYMFHFTWLATLLIAPALMVILAIGIAFRKGVLEYDPD